MRILLDGRYINDDFPGIGRYTWNLAQALGGLGQGDEILVLHNPALANSRHGMESLARSSGVRLVPCAVPRFVAAEQVLLPFVARRLCPDLVHTPFYLKPWLTPCPSVVTIFDTVPMEGRGAGVLLHRVAGRLAVRTSRLVLTTSQTSRDRLERRLGCPSARVRVTPLASDPRIGPAPPETVSDVRRRHGLHREYVLYVGSSLGHKNLGRLLEAWASVAGEARPRDFDLALAGHEPGVAVSERVRVLGRVPERDLPGLYSGATLVVLPSLEEGFGLPLLEAMACGVPVACSDIASLAEIAGDAAVRFPPRDVRAMAEAIAHLLDDAEERSALAARGLAQSRRFTWHETAAATRAAYRDALDR